MSIVALVVAAFLQLASLSFDQLRETVEAIKVALAAQYVEATEGARLAGEGFATGAGWQANGVRPDREAPAAEALDVALRLAAERTASTAK